MLHAEEELIDPPRKGKQLALRRFEELLGGKSLLKGGHVIARAGISCYVNDRLYRYAANICLVKQGYYAGTIRLHEDEEGFIDENLFLRDPHVTYSVGRSQDVLIIENQSSLNGMTRIEFEAGIS
jgi:hypothetical protein